MASTDPISSSTSNPQPSHLTPSSSLLVSMEWTPSGSKQVDSVMSELFDESYPEPGVFEKLVAGNPGMTLVQLEQQYKALIDGIERMEINPGLVPDVPPYLNKGKAVVPEKEPCMELIPWTEEDYSLYSSLNKEYGNGYEYAESSGSSDMFFEDQDFIFDFSYDVNYSK